MPTWHTLVFSDSGKQTANRRSVGFDRLADAVRRGVSCLSYSNLTAPTQAHRPHITSPLATAWLLSLLILSPPSVVLAAGGSLVVNVQDAQSKSPTAARMELYRGEASGRPLAVRKTVNAGFGTVLDRSAELSLADGQYSFRMIRGPEYRIISGTFALERTSLDEHSVTLPRMVDMLKLGWTSGDCLVPASSDDLPLRMAAEDLHLATVLGTAEARPVPGAAGKEPLVFDPLWITHDVSFNDGLAFYGPREANVAGGPDAAKPLASEQLAALGDDSGQRVAIENPFAWALPVWLASQKIDGFFVLGDWLRLDQPVLQAKDGRESPSPALGDPHSLGRYAEQIYWNLLEAGFKIPPLAGSGDEATSIPVGYNRLYVANPLAEYDSYAPESPETFPQEGAAVSNAAGWWEAAWAGRSVATNGPLLRPKLGGELPGHTFTASQGETLELAVELTLSVRDPVDYLEVIHNGRVHYSARLDEFALAGGKIPLLEIDASGWVLVRVKTRYENHFRAAISAPWYIEFDGRPRISAAAVDFFRQWQTDYEQRLLKQTPESVARHAPFIRAARQFWLERAEMAK